MIFDIIRTVIGIGGNWVERREKRAEIKLESETRIAVARAEAEVKRLEKLENAEIAWDHAVATQMETSWKDEWFTILLTLPIILAFCGEWGRARVAEGFLALHAMPDWYMFSFLSAIAASFGIRALVNRFGGTTPKGH